MVGCCSCRIIENDNFLELTQKKADSIFESAFFLLPFEEFKWSVNRRSSMSKILPSTWHALILFS